MKQDKLKDLFDFLPKSKVKAGEGLEEGKYPFYTSSQNQTKYLNDFQHEAGCLVFGTGGKANVHLTTKRFATSTDCITIRPKVKTQIDVAYVSQYFKGNIQVLEKGFKGAGLKHISKAYLSEIQIPQPEEPDDQKRISHLLSKVDGPISRRKQHFQQLDDLLRSVFLEMFGDPIINPRKFPVKKLSEFYINPKEGSKCGPFGSALKKDELVDSGIPVWNMDNIDPIGRMVLPFRMWITKEKFQELASYSVIDGDIIISRAGTVGKMCVAHMDDDLAIISTNLVRLRLGDKLRPLHFVSLMTYCKGRIGRLKTGADGAFTHMNTGILDKLEFPYPPIGLQDQFAAIVEKVEGLISRYQQSQNDLESLYGALSQKAFKGELDLSWVPLPVKVVIDRDDHERHEKNEMEKEQFELPNPADNWMDNNENQHAQIGVWFDMYLEQLNPGSSPSPEAFLEIMQIKIDSTNDDDALTAGIKEYDYLKDLIFKAIEDGRIEQTRNPIRLNDKDDLGNQVILKKV